MNINYELDHARRVEIGFEKRYFLVFENNQYPNYDEKVNKTILAHFHAETYKQVPYNYPPKCRIYPNNPIDLCYWFPEFPTEKEMNNFISFLKNQFNSSINIF